MYLAPSITRWQAEALRAIQEVLQNFLCPTNIQLFCIIARKF